MLDFEYEDQISLLRHYHNALVTADFAVCVQSGSTADPGTTASNWRAGLHSLYLVALAVPLCHL